MYRPRTGFVCDPDNIITEEEGKPSCNRPRPSFVCDPDNIITVEEGKP